MKKAFLPFFLLLFATVLSAQHGVKGIVKSESGEPLIGVTVLEKNTNNGTVTGLDGDFAMNCSNANATLVLSYIGYATQEVAVNGATALNIVLATEYRLLEQVLITGTRRANRTQTETPVPVDVIQMKQVSLTTARFDLTSLLNANAPLV